MTGFVRSSLLHTSSCAKHLCMLVFSSSLCTNHHTWALQAYQLFKARAYGADAVLLIAAVLPNKDLDYLIAAARKLGLQCLIEVSCPSCPHSIRFCCHKCMHVMMAARHDVLT